jgi:hypothetical protein
MYATLGSSWLPIRVYALKILARVRVRSATPVATVFHAATHTHISTKHQVNVFLDAFCQIVKSVDSVHQLANLALLVSRSIFGEIHASKLQ